MSQVIEILTSLGINNTVFYQFGIFFVAFISMNFIVFKPYLRAYDERVSRTVGGQEKAEQLLSKAAEKEKAYREQAKKLNGEIKEIFSEQNAKAKKETEQILAVAKKEADQKTEKARVELETAVVAARKEMENLIPEISKDIENKFMRQQ
jgi:F-type H+-transporting ATPase subunit b